MIKRLIITLILLIFLTSCNSNIEKSFSNKSIEEMSIEIIEKQGVPLDRKHTSDYLYLKYKNKSYHYIKNDFDNKYKYCLIKYN